MRLGMFPDASLCCIVFTLGFGRPLTRASNVKVRLFVPWVRCWSENCAWSHYPFTTSSAYEGHMSTSITISTKVSKISLICAFFVVCIHCKPDGILGGFTWWFCELFNKGICIIAVPFFLCRFRLLSCKTYSWELLVETWSCKTSKNTFNSLFLLGYLKFSICDSAYSHCQYLSEYLFIAKFPNNAFWLFTYFGIKPISISLSYSAMVYSLSLSLCSSFSSYCLDC